MCAAWFFIYNLFFSPGVVFGLLDLRRKCGFAGCVLLCGDHSGMCREGKGSHWPSICVGGFIVPHSPVWSLKAVACYNLCQSNTDRIKHMRSC